MNDSKYITIKIFRPTRQTAKILAAQKGETLAELIDRLIAEEADRASVEAYAAKRPKRGEQ